MNEENNNTSQASSGIVVKKNDLGFIYNPNIVKTNLLTEIHMKQILEKRTNINVHDLMLLNNYYTNIGFIGTLVFLLLIRFTFLTKYNFIKRWKLEYEYYLILFAFSFLVIFGVFLHMRTFTIIVILGVAAYLFNLYKKTIRDFLDLLFAKPKIEINLDSSLEEETEILTIDNYTEEELMSINLAMYNKSSNRVIKKLMMKYVVLFLDKFVWLLNVFLWLLMMMSFIFIAYFIYIGYDMGLNLWLVK